jgi:hypothetical protein
MAIARGPVDVKRGGRGDGSGKENPVIHLENGILPWDKQDKANLPTLAEVIEVYGGSVPEFLEDSWPRVMRRELPPTETLPTFWAEFWAKHSDKLLQSASGEGDSFKSAEVNTANARKTFAIKVSGLANTVGVELAVFAEEMIARAK